MLDTFLFELSELSLLLRFSSLKSIVPHHSTARTKHKELFNTFQVLVIRLFGKYAPLSSILKNITQIIE